jgi:two-component system phosphate regulon sensor histidine kinase PhoR
MMMLKNKTSWLMGALAIMMVSVHVLQVAGLRNTVELKREIFDHNVERSLIQISNWILVSADMTYSEVSNNNGGLVTDDAIADASRTILLRMEEMQVDSLLKIVFEKNGIEADFVLGAFDKYHQPSFLEKHAEVYRDELVDEGYSVDLGPLKLKVYFPSLSSYLLRQGIGAFLFSGFLIIVILIGLLYVFKSVRHSKQIEKIRRDLMNNLTHELKTPISTIGLASEALSDRDLVLDEEQQSYYVGLIKAENKRLGVLVHKVLQASLVEKGSMKLYIQPINTHDVVKEVVKNVAMQVRKMGGKIEVDLRATNPVIKVDKIHLTNVIFNLIDNALKYSGENPRIEIKSEQLEDGLLLKVKDNGVGIPEEHLGKVFERLYRVPTGNVHDVKGFGLGLSYVKTVVERHGGSIRVDSKLGEYSVFILKLKFDPPQE